MDHEQGGQGGLNISDVIEVIETTDPEFADVSYRMYTGNAMDDAWKHQAYVKIKEQPASKALRFRYECEGRSAGSIPGVNSTPENKTFPSIQIVGYKGRAVVVVSCVTKDPPYRPHPHNLVGKEGCKKGVCTVEIASEDMTVSFSNLGIQCVKKKDIDDALKVREDIRVDPFRTGFSHRSQPTSIDLNSVRLCFQVFLEGGEKGKFSFALAPIVSDPIYDKKAMSDLTICKLSDCSASVAGGKEIILLCEKVAKEDIQVRFYEEHNGVVVWEGFGDFQPPHVHKQVAISFRAPRYKSLEVEKPVKAFIQLRRPSDGATSDALPFEFLPLDSDPKRKRPKALLKSPTFPDQDKPMPYVMASPSPDHITMVPTAKREPIVPYVMASPSPEHMTMVPTVKREPIDPSLAPQYMFTRSPVYAVASSSPHQVTPSPSPHSVGRTPSPMEYVVPPTVSHHYMAGGGVMYDVYGVGRPDVNQQLGMNVMTNRLGQEMVAGGGGMGNYPPVMGNIPNVLAGVNMRPQSSNQLNPAVKMNVGGLPPNIPVSANSTHSSPGPSMGALLGGPNLPPGPRVGFPSTQGISNVATVTGLGEGHLLDLDRQYSLEKIDSSDLARILESNLSDHLNSNLTLSENVQQHNIQCRDQPVQESMTDSLTRLRDSAIQEICALNNLYERGGNV